jgi:hypothetical protein
MRLAALQMLAGVWRAATSRAGMAGGWAHQPPAVLDEGDNEVLSQVVITLSGYQHPVRGELRDAALSLGGLSGLSPALHAYPFCYARTE